jgi:hypothetical protein
VLSLLVFILIAQTVTTTPAQSDGASASNPYQIDFRYAPATWQTAICLPDDWQKSLVGKDGSLLYDYPGKFSGFGTRITFGIQSETTWERQELVSPRVPIVRTIEYAGMVEIETETFAVAPAVSAPGKSSDIAPERLGSPIGQTNRTSLTINPPPRHDVLIVRLRNHGAVGANVTPALTIQSESPPVSDSDRQRLRIGPRTTLQCVEAFTSTVPATNRFRVQFADSTIAPGAERTLVFCVARGTNAPVLLRNAAHAETLRRQAERFWRKLDLPYGRLDVPDAGVQALLDSAVRNIFQAREIKQGLPAFQVGPTCYRGLWVVDGSFIMESMAYLGRLAEARNGIKYLMSFQRDNGSFMLIDGHWKETGIALWAITRHARLMGDKDWLREVWPRVERGCAFIRDMRALASTNLSAPNCGLIPDGFSDGGLAGKVPEYTNIYWTLAGLRAAIAAAQWLGENPEAEAWQKEYDDFYRTFRRAAERDARTDAPGHRFVPIRMRDNADIPPQKAQWGFLHAVFPGKVFATDDPLVRGNMAMLRSVEREGLVLDTGWLKDGIWNYFASFYGHAWLWLGEGEKAARTLYAFGNHASPLLAWREEQKPVGQGAAFVGDMPHNWASAEFIRLVRHLLVLERGNELHLFEGLPPTWARAGAVLKLNHIVTEFGPMSLELRVSKNGKTARLKLDPPSRTAPDRIALHLSHWSGQTGVSDLPTRGSIRRIIQLRPITLPPGDDLDTLADIRGPR